ncbi:DUF397 domain-containing protein [Streptomyces uncialis]|uniref:DUF397 domain-containing protein n=1 Tax=Streptomyces uncialis TaxID=1048205 RepID=UPI0038686AC3|nr:DUF397 domain-containing protein [Streptomyces uncialis]
MDHWVKSSYSNHQADCVEVRTQDGAVAFRDSKRGESGPTASVSAPSWTAFLAGLQHDHA